MFIEILIGLIVACLLIYLFYIYLGWCSNYSNKLLLFEDAPSALSSGDRDYIATYKKFMLPVHLSETYKPIRFWIIYYRTLWGL
jgi:hypothetical protein